MLNEKNRICPEVSLLGTNVFIRSKPSLDCTTTNLTIEDKRKPTETHSSVDSLYKCMRILLKLTLGEPFVPLMYRLPERMRPKAHVRR